MTPWKKVRGTQVEEPKAVDMTTSPTTVYERKNIQQITIEDSVGKETKAWEYDERQMTVDEYESMQNALESPVTQTIMQAISNLELAIEMLGV